MNIGVCWPHLWAGWRRLYPSCHCLASKPIYSVPIRRHQLILSTDWPDRHHSKSNPLDLSRVKIRHGERGQLSSPPPPLVCCCSLPGSICAVILRKLSYEFLKFPFEWCDDELERGSAVLREEFQWTGYSLARSGGPQAARAQQTQHSVDWSLQRPEQQVRLEVDRYKVTFLFFLILFF